MGDKREEFKLFVRENPFLIKYVKNGKRSWQDFYEMYDLYGDDEEAWGKLLDDEVEESRDSNSKTGNGYLEELINTIKNVDVDKVQDGIQSLQKTLGLVGELFAGKSNNGDGKAEYNPRPLYKRFED